MPGSGKTAADWIDELAALGLVRRNAQSILALEKLLGALRSRKVRDPEEMADSVASLLAWDDDRYHKIREHFLRSFLGELPRHRTGGPIALHADVSSIPQTRRVPLWERSTPSTSPWSVVVQRIGRMVGGRAWIVLGAAAILAAAWYGPKEILDVVDRIRPLLVKPAAFAQMGVGRAAKSALTRFDEFDELLPCANQGPSVELVSAPPAIVFTAVPQGELRPTPLWFFVTLGVFSLGFGLVAAYWWFIDKPYASDRAKAKRDAEDLRDAVIGKTETLGALYDVDRAPPFEVSAIDDAATLLGRLARQGAGFDLDVPRTIDATIASGGRIKPVFAQGGHRDALLVWVDVEDGSHPYLDGVEWLLERWKRLGVPFVRYNFHHVPEALKTPSDKRAISIDRLGRRTEGMPLVVFSRMAMPQDIDGKMPWLRQLDPWPVRVWLDLNPHGTDDSRGDVARLLPRITARLARYPFSKAGLMQCATLVAHKGQTPAQRKDDPFAKSDSAMERALLWWAGAAACVPNPTWVHLDDLRRLLPEVSSVFRHQRDVQHLIEYTWQRGVGEGAVGDGESLRFSDEGRRVLLEEFRHEDRSCFGPDNLEAYVEYRVRMRLIRQLAKARREGDEFGEAKRAMKIDVHRAAIGQMDIPALIEEHGKGPAAAELEPLLLELKHLQQTKLPGPVKKRWSVALEDTVDAWYGTLRGARTLDFVRPWAWRAPHGWLFVAVLILVANVVALWFVRPFVRNVEQTIEMPATRKVVVPDEPPALCDVAPMAFVKIPAGEFVMGSPESEKDRDDDEVQHRVHVGAFEMGMYEVTQKQWQIVMETKPFDCDYGCGDDLPAQNVSMYDVMKFMNKLTDRENRGRSLEQQRTRCYDETNWSWDRACTGYRLPTETEWEYAARATTAYSFGNEAKDLCAYGNGADFAAKPKHPSWTVNEACDDGYADLAPVGKYKPNPWVHLQMNTPFSSQHALHIPIPPPWANDTPYTYDPTTSSSRHNNASVWVCRNLKTRFPCRSNDWHNEAHRTW